MQADDETTSRYFYSAKRFEFRFLSVLRRAKCETFDSFIHRFVTLPENSQKWITQPYLKETETLSLTHTHVRVIEYKH